MLTYKEGRNNFINDNDKCNRLELKYYVDQHSEYDDSYHGTLVFPLSDYIVEVYFTC